MTMAVMSGLIVQAHSCFVRPGKIQRITKAATRTGMMSRAVHLVGDRRWSSRTSVLTGLEPILMTVPIVGPRIEPARVRRGQTGVYTTERFRPRSLAV